MTISEVSKKYGLSADTLRYYEKVGIISKVKRSKSGLRDYTEKDCIRIEFAICMRSAGLPIEPLRKYVAMVEAGDATLEARKDLLIEQRTLLKERIQKMTESLEFLETKIQRHDEKIASRDSCSHA